MNKMLLDYAADSFMGILYTGLIPDVRKTGPGHKPGINNRRLTLVNTFP